MMLVFSWSSFDPFPGNLTFWLFFWVQELRFPECQDAQIQEDSVIQKSVAGTVSESELLEIEKWLNTPTLEDCKTGQGNEARDIDDKK